MAITPRISYKKITILSKFFFPVYISATASSSTKNKSGNTSDDTGDEFKPSSLLEGITLKPVNSGSIERSKIFLSVKPFDYSMKNSILTLNILIGNSN